MNIAATMPKVRLATADYVPELHVAAHHFVSGHILYALHAQAMGYFTQEKLYVNLARLDHSPKVIKALKHDIFPIGLATATTFIRDVAQWVAEGNDPGAYPLAMVYQADQSFSSAFYWLAQGYREQLGLPTYPDEKTFGSLVGKRVRTGGGTPTELFWILAHKHGLLDRVNDSLEANGFDPDKINLSWVPEFSVKTYSNLLLKGELDVYSKPSFGHGQFLGRAKTTNEGLRHAYFSTIEAGLPPLYGVGIIVRKDFAEDHADMLSAFLRAIDRAMPECIADPMIAVRYMNRQRGFGPEYDEIEGIKGAITAGKYPDITGGYGFYESDDTKKYGYGCIRNDKLEQLIHLLGEAGRLAADVKPQDLYINFDWRR